MSVFVQKFLLRFIRWYQSWRPDKPSPCRFFPSCSVYSHEAIEIHGPWRGGWLMIRRLSRCRPFGPFGFDPVPENNHHQHTNLGETSPTVISGQNGPHESC